ncbi:MAG: DUF4834 family protein [Prevotellaceae bacterium]|nr:DUF4834 family protein [Prevotellaceae bacterium]
MEILIVLLIMVALWLMPNMARVVLGWIARYAGRRIEKFFGGDDDGSGNAGSRTKPPPRPQKKVDATVGEYVDYEEIKTND